MARRYKMMKTENIEALAVEAGVINDGDELSREALIAAMEAHDGMREEAREDEAEPETDAEAMNELARRIWGGQSVSLNNVERVRRIALRLRERGYEDLSGLALPVTDVEISKGIK